jgi:hypothetical protein
LFGLHSLFFLGFGFCFGFSGAFIFCAGSCGKAERPSETRHDRAVFLIARGRAVKIPQLDCWFTPSPSDHDRRSGRLSSASLRLANLPPFPE